MEHTSIVGVIVAVYGKEPEDDKGKFHVEDYCFQLLPEQPPLPRLAEDRFVPTYWPRPNMIDSSLMYTWPHKCSAFMCTCIIDLHYFPNIYKQQQVRLIFLILVL